MRLQGVFAPDSSAYMIGVVAPEVFLTAADSNYDDVALDGRQLSGINGPRLYLLAMQGIWILLYFECLLLIIQGVKQCFPLLNNQTN